MLARRTLLALALILVSSAAALAQPSLAVNDVLPPAIVTATAGGSVSVLVSGGPGSRTDWIALYPLGASDRAFLSWQ
ncbi:MAG TPA: hypothetical protein VGK32_14385 [Vicinamibacterales bacterium]|jgi:hypothetical protein